MTERDEPADDEDCGTWAFDDVLDLVTKKDLSDCVAQLFCRDGGQWISVTELLTTCGKTVEWSTENISVAWLSYPGPGSNFRIILFFDEASQMTNTAIYNASVLDRHVKRTNTLRD